MRLGALSAACAWPALCGLSSAEGAWPLRLHLQAGFEEICDQNQYVESEDGRLVAVFRSGEIAERGPFKGRANEAAFASSDCLTSDEAACGGWVRVVADRPITGLSLDGGSMDVRVEGEGVYRVFPDGAVQHVAGVDEEPCQGVEFYVAGCLGPSRLDPPPAASAPGGRDLLSFSFRMAGQDLTLLGLGGDAASRRVVVRSGLGTIERACPASPV
ncbi:hypothetical protein [Caulobacter endophyticus]|uniref:hypothetical protein n=1 Tax=Caulobacter endophyticus TaxID=2172652 RepID=UPI00240F1209|nr:hypothetical protein [Caulobacter endophyticus]MDG2527895.1 hypothetical protein [Caulobacter endophyticus]